MSFNKYKDDTKFRELCLSSVGRIQCLSFKVDRAGAVTDCLMFKFGNNELMYLSTFYGCHYTLNPGPKHSALDPKSLTEEERDYIWECHKASGMFI